MSYATVERIGLWHVVKTVQVCSLFGEYRETVWGAYRNPRDAADLRDTLQKAIEGVLKIEALDGPPGAS